MFRVAICGTSRYGIGSYLSRGFERLGHDVAHIDGDDVPDPGSRPADYFRPPSAESSVREFGDTTWLEFRDLVNGRRFDLIVILEGMWSFFGPRTSEYKDTVVVYIAADPYRGPEKHLRDVLKSGAVHIFSQSLYYSKVYESPGASKLAEAWYYKIKPDALVLPDEARHPTVSWLPFSYDDTMFAPDPDARPVYDLVFAGCITPRTPDGKSFIDPYGEGWHRTRTVEKLAEEETFSVHIPGRLPHAEWAKVIHSAKIVLQYNNGPYPAVTGMTLRTFETLGSGKFLLSNEDRDNLTVFQPGIHFGSFRVFYHPLHHNFMFDYEHLRDVIRRWLDHDEVRQQVAQAGYEEVRAQHRPEDRVTEILRALRDRGWVCER